MANPDQTLPKFRSKYEHRIWNNCVRRDLEVAYEPKSAALTYHVQRKYFPDFVLPNGVVVEAKGYFRPADRGKMRRVKLENPELDIRLLFQRATTRVGKSAASMTYGEWADKHGFPWAEGDSIPRDWFND